ncbi:MAG: alkaline phosphatase family protein [Myxococcota bacterium]|nr:alkaline phosphatase family protein [Myxococcota bacterium]
MPNPFAALGCAALWIAALLALPNVAGARSPGHPKLVLQITVDALRADQITRQWHRFGDDGFRALLSRGTVFTEAHHAHANTETIVGHTTLATGAHPGTHGMVGNVWFDEQSGRPVYNIEDGRYRLLTRGAGVVADTEIDPTQKVAKVEGRSPSNILVTTLSDEIARAGRGQALVFGVSIKDRGAVALAGHAGKAFWFSKQSGDFVTSDYYYEAYPEWVDAFNARRLAREYGGKQWELLRERKVYRAADADDVPWETELAGFGRVFPHPFGDASGKYFLTLLTTSPAGDALTLAFTKELLAKEPIGEDAVTDYLSVSFSSNDYVSHLFGPSSLESEDQMLRLDGVLAELLRAVDERVGLESTLVVLSADHGSPDPPGQLRQLGIPARYVNPDDWDRAPAIAALESRFGVGQGLIRAFTSPYVHLDRARIAEAGADPVAVELAVAEEIEKMPEVAAAVPRSRLLEGALPDSFIHRAVAHNFHRARSGDIHVVFESNSFINDFDSLVVAATHGSPYRYDTHVPLVFAGPGIPAQRVQRRVLTVDVAPTLAALIGIEAPSGAEGRVLPEVFATD